MNKKTLISILIPFFIIVISSFFLIQITLQEKEVDIACKMIEMGENEKAKGHIEKLKNINAMNKYQQNALMTSCKVGNSKMIEYLIDKGANLNFHKGGSLTPLEFVALSGYNIDINILDYMLKEGANPQEYKSTPPLFLLASNFPTMTNEEKENASKIAMSLIKKKSPLKYQGTTILHLAAANNVELLTKELIHTKQGIVLLQEKDRNNKTPWDLAYESGSIKTQRAIRDLEKEYNDLEKEHKK